MRTVKQEYKVLKRLQDSGACRQTVRVYEGGEHPWSGAPVHTCLYWMSV